MRWIFMVSLSLFFICGSAAQDTINLTDPSGRKQGLWIKKDSTGKKVYEGRFVNGHPEGVFSYFYPDGTLKTRSVFSQGGKKAATVSYFKNGSKMAAGNYVDEKRDSIWVFFSEYTGKILAEENYKLGIRDGISRVFFPDSGGVSEIVTHTKGIKEGTWQQFYTDGAVKVRGTYKGGEKEGVFMLYYPSGKVRTSGFYKSGHQDREWIYYNEQGKITLREIYDRGRLIKKEELPGK